MSQARFDLMGPGAGAAASPVHGAALQGCRDVFRAVASQQPPARRLHDHRGPLSKPSLQSPPSPLSLDVLSPSLSLSVSVSLAPEVTCRPRRCSTAGVRVLFGGAAAKLGRTGTGVSPRERVLQSTP